MEYWVFRPFMSRGAGLIDAYPKRSPAGWKFDEGVSLAAKYPKNATVKFSANFRDARELRDFQPNTLNAMIASPKARDLVAALDIGGIEVLPVALQDHTGKVVGADYAFLNPLGSQDAIDMERSVVRMDPLDEGQISRVKNLVLATSRIDPEAKLFRCTTFLSVFLVRDDVKQAFEKAGLTGTRFFPAEGWDGLDI